MKNTLRFSEEIRDNYERYLSIIRKEKKLTEKTVQLDEDKKSRVDTKEKNVLAICSELDEEVTLTVQQKKILDTDFKFFLRCKQFCQKPLFRYDSSGPTHRNSSLLLPIEEQQVPTPHFHKYQASGEEIAYKTDILQDKHQAKALEDISLCIHHFFNETNIIIDDFELISSPGRLPFKKEHTTDPLENVNFD